MLQALRDEIIVEPIYEETKSSLVIPEGCKVYKQYHGKVYGVVISVGPKYLYREVQPGCKIAWVRHEGKKIIYEGKTYFALKGKWALAVIGELCPNS